MILGLNINEKYKIKREQQKSIIHHYFNNYFNNHKQIVVT